MGELLSRAKALAQVRFLIAGRFPGAVVSTNDDANPATPMAVTAAWRKQTIIKTVRADSITATPEEFSRKAMRVLTAFQDGNVPSRYHRPEAQA